MSHYQYNLLEQIEAPADPFIGMVRKLNPPRKKIQRTKIGQEMTQLILNFEASPSILDMQMTEAHTDAPALYEVPHEEIHGVEENNTGVDYTIVNSAYIDLAIDLLLTCAEDLVQAQRVLDADPTTVRRRARQRAEETILHTKAWLLNDWTGLFDKEGRPCGFQFTFHDCAELLEEELSLQSLGQIAIPRIADRADEMAAWIIDDPEQAKYVFSNYKKLFSQRDDMSFEEEEDFTEEPQRQRHGA